MTRKLLTILTAMGLAGGCLMQTHGCTSEAAARGLSVLAADSRQTEPGPNGFDADWPSCSLEPWGPQF